MIRITITVGAFEAIASTLPFGSVGFESYVGCQRWLVVLTCYLDDSGKDPQNRVTTIAGYIARDDAWKSYESEVEPIFAEYGVSVLHAKDLHNTDGEFKNWPVLKKQSFVAQLCLKRPPFIMMGLSMSAVKSTYKEKADKSGKKRVVTPYTFLF
jgi:hypothetical protein